MKKADIGLIGLAVMGENLAMNMESKGFTVAVYNRSTEKVDAFLAGRAAGRNFIGCHSPEELVQALSKPRKIFMMVKAGAAVDALIEQLLPLLESTAATATIRIPCAARQLWKAKACFMSAAAFPAARKAR